MDRRRKRKHNDLRSQSSKTLHDETGCQYYDGPDPTSKQRRRMPVEYRRVPVGQWPVHDILQARNSHGQQEYLVDWKPNPLNNAPFKPTWEPEQHIELSLLTLWKSRTATAMELPDAIEDRESLASTEQSSSQLLLRSNPPASNDVDSTLVLSPPPLHLVRGSIQQTEQPSEAYSDFSADLTIAQSAIKIEHYKPNYNPSNSNALDFEHDHVHTSSATRETQSSLQSLMHYHFPCHKKRGLRDWPLKEIKHTHCGGLPFSALPQPVEPCLHVSNGREPLIQYYAKPNMTGFPFEQLLHAKCEY